MAFEYEDIRKSQEIFACLLENHELSEDESADLFDAYTTSEAVPG